MAGDGYMCWKASELEYQMVGQFFSLDHYSFTPVQVSCHRPYFFESLLCEQISHRYFREFDEVMTYIESFVRSRHCLRSYKCTNFCPHFRFQSAGPRSNTLDYTLSSLRPIEVRNLTFWSLCRNKKHVLILLSPLADKMIDDDLAVLEDTHRSSSCAVSTISTDNTSSNWSRSGSFSVLLCSHSSRATEYMCKRIEMLMKQ
jgi:hypothetical protein